jgi:aryl-alcohol dehydrogenase-like predicted oxidoreductase
MHKRLLGRTGLLVSPIALGGAPLGYVQASVGWDPTRGAGRNLVLQSLHRALDLGINYFDTAAAYGEGLSEVLIGEVMASRRRECVLASKVWHELDHDGVLQSVEASLGRLNTDYIDIMQVHGVMYSPAAVEHVLHGGPLAALRKLRAAGRIGHIGITAEEPWTALPFLAHPDFEVFQVAYNFIRQGAAAHFLPEAAAAGVGIVAMRTVTSGVFQREMKFLAPDICARHDLYELALKFVLADSRIHSGIVGMRGVEEVDRNARLVESWVPPTDMAGMPRTTFQLYAMEDQESAIRRT